MPRRYVVLDVFTGRRLAGNPLAVVLEADGLDDAAMQAIAREFNLSETVFVEPPREARHRARLRIFTPLRELPFAGHPTVGSAVLLALEAGGAEGGADAVAFGLEEKVGTVSCVVEVDRAGRAGRARFRLPRLPAIADEAGRAPQSTAEIAWALGLRPEEIGFDRHAPSRHDAGVPYDLVPLASLDALARAAAQGEAFTRVFGGGGHPAAYLYARDPGAPGTASAPALRFRARMFARDLGVAEDPATGSAAAAFAGALMQFEPLGEGEHDVAIAQGVEMGRPSAIALQLVIREGALASAEIGGEAVVVAEGSLLV